MDYRLLLRLARGASPPSPQATLGQVATVLPRRSALAVGQPVAMEGVAQRRLAPLPQVQPALGQVFAGPVDKRQHRRGRALERARRSEEHTSELQSLRHLVCRLLLEKKK